MFSGATMEDVESDYDQGDGSGVIPKVRKERLNMLFIKRRRKRKEYLRE